MNEVAQNLGDVSCPTTKAKHKPYPVYCNSGIEWLGDVPEMWKLKRLKYVVTYNDDSLPESVADDYIIQYVDISSVDIVEGIQKTEELKFFEAPSRARRKVRDDDTIISTVRTYLKAIAFVDKSPDNLIVSTGFAVVRPSAQLNPKYLTYYLRSQGFVEAVVAHSVGVSYPAINPSILVTLTILLPQSISEQQSIADYLDEKTAKIDALVEKKQRLIELLKEKRTALISHAVTKGLDPNAKMKDSDVEWLREVPEGWEIKKLKYIAKLKSGESITSEDIEESGEFPVYGGNGLRGYYSKYTHYGHFVLIGRQGALCGNINYGEGKFWASEHAVVASPNEIIETIWLGELLRIMNLNQYSVSAAQPGLAIDKIKELLCPFPSFTEQKQIVTFIKDETAKIDALIEKVQTAIDKLKEYRTALISAAVTGKIDVREKRAT